MEIGEIRQWVHSNLNDRLQSSGEVEENTLQDHMHQDIDISKYVEFSNKFAQTTVGDFTYFSYNNITGKIEIPRFENISSSKDNAYAAEISFSEWRLNLVHEIAHSLKNLRWHWFKFGTLISICLACLGYCMFEAFQTVTASNFMPLNALALVPVGYLILALSMFFKSFEETVAEIAAIMVARELGWLSLIPASSRSYIHHYSNFIPLSRINSYLFERAQKEAFRRATKILVNSAGV